MTENVIASFLRQYWTDQDAEGVRPLDEYLGMYPGHAEAVAQAWIELTSEGAPEDAAEDMIGPYALESEIGRGGMGVVFRATDTRVNRRVALKVIDRLRNASDSSLERFRREAEVAARLEHPGICRVYEAGLDGAVPYIAMELISGRTLAARLGSSHEAGTTVAVHTDASGTRRAEDSGSSHTRGEVLELASIVEGVAAAVATAHEAGIVHRDIKPANIMIREDGSPVLMDFGLAREVEEGDLRLTRSGFVCGTPGYMSPEQIDGRTDAVDARTDVWALGVTLYECLAGRLPFEAATVDELHRKIRTVEPTSLRRRSGSIPRDLDLVVQTALDKDPDRRYLTARDLADDLARVRRLEPVRARPITTWTRVRRWTQRNPAVASSLGVGTAALVVGLVVALVQLGHARESEALADERATEARRRLEDWDRLADGFLLDNLVREANEDLWPVTPDRAPAMRRWIDEVSAVLDRAVTHERFLATLRTRALPHGERDRRKDDAAHAWARRRLQDLERKYASDTLEIVTRREEAESLGARVATMEERDDLTPVQYDRLWDMRMRLQAGNRRLGQLEERIAGFEDVKAELIAETERRTSWTFDDDRLQFQHDSLVDHLRAVDGVRGEHDPARVTLAGMKARLESAESMVARTVDAHRDAWAAAARRVAADERFGGLELVAQVGLIPLGPDPESGLEEFLDPATGTRPERNDETDLYEMGRVEGVVFVLIPGGSFLMGAQPDDADLANHDPRARLDEGPVNEVTLEPFLLSKYEMTQGQWLRTQGTNPSNYDEGHHLAGYIHNLSHPVEQVNHPECTEALRRLGMVIPTEAQWEYACRAGTSTPTYCDSGDIRRHANLADQTARTRGGVKVWTFVDWSDGWVVHAPVGRFLPNPWGFHDMYGNVFEWCRDMIVPYDQPAVGPEGLRTSLNGTSGATRGGDYQNNDLLARSAIRTWVPARSRTNARGVRPARRLER